MSGIEERKHRLLLEFELPDHYAEDFTPEALAWFMEETGDSYEEALLGSLMMSTVNLLVLEAEGDKDSDVLAVTAVLKGARLVEAPPDEQDYTQERAHLAWRAWRDLQEEAERAA